MWFVNVSITLFQRDHDWYGQVRTVCDGNTPLVAHGVLLQAIQVLMAEAWGFLKDNRDEIDLLAEVSPCTEAEAKQHGYTSKTGPITILKGAWEKQAKLERLVVEGSL